MTVSNIVTQSIQSSALKVGEASQEVATKSAEAIQEAASKPTAVIERILHFDDLPTWMQVDPHIQRGYRRQSESFRACLLSLFYPHNELINTWSHLSPACCYLALLFAVDYSALHNGANISPTDNLVIQIYLGGTTICLFLSAFYHGTNAHSERIARHLLKLDYLGVVLSISVTNVSSTYFGLYDDPLLQKLYISLSVACAIAVFRSLLHPHADGPGAAAWRSIILLALGGSGWAPIVHKAVVEGIDGLRNFPLAHTIVTCMCYVTGTAIYVSHLPEKRWPRTFDLWGASHQIFHILVALGQFVFLLGLTKRMLMHYPSAVP